MPDFNVRIATSSIVAPNEKVAALTAGALSPIFRA
jgi:hypothetical protein